MRIGVVPERVRDRLALHSRRFPLPVFDVMGTMMLSRAVMAGVYFRVFDRLAPAPKSAKEVAREAGCDLHGMKLLLDALVACHYLEQEAGRYRNARLAADWLLSDSPQTLANFVRFNYDQWNWVSRMEEFIQHGASQDIHQKLEEASWRNYMLGLRDLATLSADEVVNKLKFRRPPHSLLDVGGGHAHYAVAFCRRYPDLQAMVVDLQPAARIGREVVERAGLSDRIEFRTGHLSETPFGEHHDLALFFNVAHHLDEATNRSALKRLHAALASKGKLIVWEPFQEEKKQGQKDQLGKLLALFFGVTSREQTYTFEQVAGWAQEAGFNRIRRQSLQTAPFAALLVAEKEN